MLTFDNFCALLSTVVVLIAIVRMLHDMAEWQIHCDRSHYRSERIRKLTRKAFTDFLSSRNPSVEQTLIQRIVTLVDEGNHDDKKILLEIITLDLEMFEKRTSNIKTNCIYYSGSEHLIKCAINPAGECSKCLDFDPKH
jgi:Family of unknown function (DUF6464)